MVTANNNNNNNNNRISIPPSVVTSEAVNDRQSLPRTTNPRHESPETTITYPTLNLTLTVTLILTLTLVLTLTQSSFELLLGGSVWGSGSR